MGFYVDWSVTREDGSPVFTSPLQSFSCRDGAFYTMSRGVRARFEQVVGIPKIGYGDFDTSDITNAAWRLWVLTSEQKLTYSGSFHHATGMVERDVFLRDYAIPHAIEKLHNKYPTVTFEQIESSISDGFGGNQKSVPGVRVTGDWSVIPAFYWSGLLQRYSFPYDMRQKPTEWKDVTKLLQDRGDSDHRQGWQRLREGKEPSARFMMAFQSGPLSMYQNQVTEAGYVDTLLGTRDRMSTSKRGWFEMKEI